MTKMAKVAYGHDHPALTDRNRQYKEWVMRQPKCFTFFHSEIFRKIGFICILPLNSRTRKGKKHHLGLIREFEIENTTIAKGSSNLILIQGVWLKLEFSDNTAVVAKWLECFFKHIAEFMPLSDKQIDSTIIYVESTSLYNELFLVVLGFIETGKKSPSGNKLFEINFGDNDKDTPNTYHTKMRIIYYVDLRRKNNSWSAS